MHITCTLEHVSHACMFTLCVQRKSCMIHILSITKISFVYYEDIKTQSHIKIHLEVFMIIVHVNIWKYTMKFTKIQSEVNHEMHVTIQKKSTKYT